MTYRLSRAAVSLVPLMALVFAGCSLDPNARSRAADTHRHEHDGHHAAGRAREKTAENARPAPKRASRRAPRRSSGKKVRAAFTAKACKLRKLPVHGRQPKLVRYVRMNGKPMWAYLYSGLMELWSVDGTQKVASMQMPGTPLDSVQWPADSITVVFGRDRAHPRARFLIYNYRFINGTLRAARMYVPATTRPDLNSLKVRGGKLYVTHFLSKYVAQTMVYDMPGNRPRVLRKEKMLFDAEPVGSGMVFVRLYGDRPGSRGEAYFISKNNRLQLKTISGGRAVAVADLDGTGKKRIYVADGWNKAYRDRARPYISVFEPGSPELKDRLTMGSGFGVFRLVPADLDGDHRDELVAVTNTGLFAVDQAAEVRQLGEIRGMPAPVQVVDVDGDSMAEIVISEVPGYCEVR